jgi:hypothetical protein
MTAGVLSRTTVNMKNHYITVINSFFDILRIAVNSSKQALGVLEGIRTPDPRFRKPVLYPAELPRRGEGSIIGRIDCAIAGWALIPFYDDD